MTERDEEKALVMINEICADVLGIDAIDADDNFFLLGGHSLLVLEVVEAIAASTGVSVPLQCFFADPTPRGLATYVAR